MEYVDGLVQGEKVIHVPYHLSQIPLALLEDQR